MAEQANPLQHLQQAVAGFGSRVSRDVGSLIQNFDRQLQPFRDQVGRWHQSQQQQHQPLRRQHHHLRSSWAPALAVSGADRSVTSRPHFTADSMVFIRSVCKPLALGAFNCSFQLHVHFCSLSRLVCRAQPSAATAQHRRSLRLPWPGTRSRRAYPQSQSTRSQTQRMSSS
jgi:hypothetical protein